MKKSVTNNYVLVDLGNTCLKACIYNKQTQKISNCFIDSNQITFKQIINKLHIKNIAKVIFVASAGTKLQNSFLKQIKQCCNNVQIVDRKILEEFLDLSNFKKNVVIGNDILLAMYYSSKQYDKAAWLAMGTVYYLIINNKNKVITVHLIPNLASALDTIYKKTSIPDKLTPNIFDKDIGLNTPDAFAAGLKTTIDGYLELIAKRFNIPKKHIFISGGDAYRFKSLAKKYSFVPFGSMKALALLTKEKKW